MKLQRKCKECGEILKPNKKGRLHPNRVFCNQNCNARFHTRITYQKMKNEPHFRKLRREAFERWKLRNPERFRKMVNDANRKRTRRVVQERREKGVCVYCGRKKDRPDRVGCLECRTKKWIKDKNRRYKKKKYKNEKRI